MKPRELQSSLGSLNETPGSLNYAPESSNLIVVVCISAVLATSGQQKHYKRKGGNREPRDFILVWKDRKEGGELGGGEIRFR